MEFAPKECSCSFLDICPISVNSMYRAYKGRTILSAKGRQFKKDIADILQTKDINKIIGDVVVEIYLEFSDKRKRDVDNYAKSIIDSLKDVMFEDDCCIQKLSISKKVGIGKNGIYVKVSEFIEPE